MSETRWTIAYRKPTANRFRRVTDWSGTWAQARDRGDQLIAARPELEVWVVTTDASELNGLLTNSGRLVRVVDTGTILEGNGNA